MATRAGLLPVIPIVFALWALLRFVTGLDELERRIQLEAFAFSFFTTSLGSFTYGFLESAGFPQLSWVYLFPMMILLWGLGLAVASRRYQ